MLILCIIHVFILGLSLGVHHRMWIKRQLAWFETSRLMFKLMA